MSLELSIEGLEDLQKVTDPERLMEALEDALDQATVLLRDEAKKMPPVNASRTGYGAKGIPVAPKYGGTLRQEIRKRKLQALAAEVFGGAHYTTFVHDGTSRMPARPFFKWLLEDFQGTQMVEEVFERTIERAMRP